MLLHITQRIGGCDVDIFKFINPVVPTKLEQGEIINGLKSKLWIERYREAGEFSLIANASTNIRNVLPIGSFISHVNSTEVMIVENHQIKEDRGKETEIVVSGRGFETYFENRIVGSDKSYPTSTGVVDYVLPANYTWIQARDLIRNHILASYITNDDDDQIPYVSVIHQLTGSGVSEERSFSRDTLYKHVLDLLKIDSLGIKVVRPGPWSPLASGSPNIAVAIHVGVDRTSEIVFSYDTGEIQSADYLWSNKKLKNTAVVSGKWVETLVTTSETKYNRRMMHIDASDIDNAYNAAPTGATLTAIIAAMQQRGIIALASQKDVALTNAEVSKDVNKEGYRTTFDVGDLITVLGDYNESTIRRISEYVEIEDETGQSGYPTLTVEDLPVGYGSG